MAKKYFPLVILIFLVAATVVTMQSQDGKTVVNAAVKAMGVENLKTIQLSGSGSTAGIGQNINPNTGWPTVYAKSYVRQIDLDAGASSTQLVRVQNGADTPQSLVIPANGTWDQKFDYWVTPFGFLKGAMANPVTLRSEAMNGANYKVVTFVLQNKYKVEGYINDANLVERVRTWIDNDVLGDMLVEGIYSDYKDFNGVKAPTFAIVRQGGFPTLILAVNDVKANAPVTIPAPPAPPAPVTVTVQSEKVADGVYYLKGGTHHSVLVEFSNYVAVIEAPQNEARSLAVMAEVKKLVPNKPIQYVINTHHHFDHSGGLRAYVDAGATIITNDVNKDFYTKAFATPRTLNPDRLQQSKKQATIEVTGNKKTLTDGTRTLELDLIQNNPHNDGIMLAYLPKEKIVVEADLYNPPAANAPAPAANAPVNPGALALLDNVEKLRLDFETILPLHGPGKVTRADLYAFVRKPVVPMATILNPPTPPPAAAGGGGGRGGRGGGGRGGAAAPAIAVAPEDAPLQSMLESSCTSCHTLDRVNNKKGDKDAWTTTVTRMMGKGASLSDQDAPKLIDFLTRTRGQ